MDICGGIAVGTYYACLENVEIAARAVYDAGLQMAVNEEKELNSSHGNVAEDPAVSGMALVKNEVLHRYLKSLRLMGITVGKYLTRLSNIVFVNRAAIKKQ